MTIMKSKVLLCLSSLLLLFSMTNIASAKNVKFDVTISAGGGSSFAIQYDGTLWGWGWQFDYENQSKSDAEKSQLSPVKIMDNVAYVSTGNTFTAVIKTDGSLWTWGVYSYGTNGGLRIASQPLTRIMDNVIAFSVGSDHVLAIKYDNSLWAWGGNGHGQLGNGTTIVQHDPIKIMDYVIAVSAGSSHSMAIKPDGSLWGWGANWSGQLGDGTTTHRQYRPVKIMENVSAVSAGLFHTVAIRTDGSLWAWGDNVRGEVGDGTRETRRTPVKIMEDVVAISAGGDVMPGRMRAVTLAITTDNSLWAWGGDWTDASEWTGESPIAYYGDSPAKIMDDVVAVSVGDLHSMALRADGSLWAWGENFYGQLGNNSTTHSATPIKIMDNIMLPSGLTPTQLTGRSLIAIFTIGSLEFASHGEVLTNDVAPFIDGDRTMVPLRAIMYTLGATVEWIDSPRSVEIRHGDTALTLAIDVPLPDNMGTPVIINDRTFVPLRYVTETFGAHAEWDGVNQSARIYQ